MQVPKRKYKRRKALTLFDLQWEDNYSRLLKFKEKYKHVKVPRYFKEDPVLGNWVVRQIVRKIFLSAERIDKLNIIGFVWNTFDESWSKMYEQLNKFHQKFGHCDVSSYDQKYNQLGEWVGKQRKDYKIKEPRLTPFKIRQLKKLGFDWGISNTGWEERFEQLKAFKKRFGHTVVPHRWEENVPLSFWVKIQRRNKEKHSPEKLKKLKSIEFIWVVSYKDRAKYRLKRVFILRRTNPI